MRAILCLTTAALVFAETKLPPPANIKIDFEKHVQPILSQKCHSCHGEEAQQSGLRLDRRQAAMRGGDYGPVIIPGDSVKSKLIHRVANGDGGLQMPPTGPLSDEEVGILRAWIDQGADFRIQVKEVAPRPVDPKLAGLIVAVRHGDTKAVESLVATKPDLINAKDAAGATPLHHAAGFGNLPTMKLLLAKGADVNAGNRRKSTPLFWALHDERKVRLLLDNGANVNVKSIDGRTPLYQVSMLPNAVATLRLLLDKGADPNAATLAGQTPLMSAARASVEAMRLLIEKGADVNTKSAANFTALMFASQAGDAAAVKLLLAKGADANVRSKRNETALAEAATTGNAEIVKALIDKHVDVDVQDIRGYSALLYAAGSDALPAEVVKMLMANGANPEFKGDGETARMLAAKRGATDVARLLGFDDVAARVQEGGARERSVADAVRPAFDLLEKQSHNFIRIGGCNSCHAQDLPSAAAAIARERGLPAPKQIPQLPVSMHALNPSRIMDLVVVGPTGMGWELFDSAMNGVPRDEYTDATVRYLKAMQTAEGNWRTFASRRPPMNTGAYQAAALSIHAMKTYGPPTEKTETDEAIARAVAWLERSTPTDTQDRAFHLMGLVWGNAKRASIEASAKALVALQRENGGWSQLPTLQPDAYATGQALYALAISGKGGANSQGYAKGIKYLLRTQAEDGSWHVKSRSIWVQPYFESGFPYGHDQWISAAGTSWATMALATSVEPQRTSQNLPRR
jgi:ankyrin repeat protein